MKGSLKIDYFLCLFMSDYKIVKKSLRFNYSKPVNFSDIPVYRGILEFLGPTIHHKLSNSQKQSLLSLPPNLFVPIYSVLSGKF